MNTAENLRRWAMDIRRHPAPISEAIPIVLTAADELDALAARLAEAEREIGRANTVYERGAYILMEMMKAYERRIRSDCKSQADIDAKPWECAEYMAAADFLRTTWPRAADSASLTQEPKT